MSVPNCPESEPAPDHNLWDNIQRGLQINILFEQYATADDNIDASEDLTEAEIIKRVHAVTNGSNKDGEDPDNLEEDDDETAVMVTSIVIADESEIIHNSAQFLCCIAQQKAYCIQSNLPDRGIEILSELEQLVIGSELYTCNKQTKYFLFFGQRGLQSNTIGVKAG